MFKYLLVILLWVSSGARADIGRDLKQFFDRAGTRMNATSPGSFKDQTAGYYTFGGLNLRNRVRNSEFAQIQLPGYRGGCGGIDLWSGGFRFISGQELGNTLRNIGSSALSYALMLAIQTVSPQTYNTLNELNALIQKINSFNINSCESAATLLGGVWPKSEEASQYLCKVMGTSQSEFGSWVDARHGCGSSKGASVISNHQNRPEYRNILVGEYNLTWKALSLNRFLNAEENRHKTELLELFMSLVGSIVSRKEEEAFRIRVLSGHPDDDEVLNALLLGGEARIYRCDETEKCLNPVLSRRNINPQDALLYQVNAILSSLSDKIFEDLPISTKEQAFLNAVNLPVYKMLNVMTAYRKGGTPLDITQYADLIAMDILFKYILEILDVVNESVDHLKSSQVNNDEIDKFIEMLRHARTKVTAKRSTAYQHMDHSLSFIQATQVIEKQLHIMLGNVVGEDSWF